MAKYKVRQGCQLLYPDGSVRGERGYVVDGLVEPETVAAQADSLQRSGRQSVVSPVDASRLVTEKPKAKKKATKKKSAKKKD